MLHRPRPYVSNRSTFEGRRAPFCSAGRNPANSKGLRRVTDPAGPFGLPYEQGVKESDVAGEDPIVSGMAGRYATALFELARDEKALDAVKADLERFETMMDGSPDLMRLVRSPVFGADEQLRAVSAIMERTGIAGLAANFIKLIVKNRRLFAIRQMIRGFRHMVARHRGEVTAEVTAAESLSDSHIGALKAALKAVTGGKDVELDINVDPAIIGGLVVKVGSRMVDTSLRTKLNAIKFAMKEAR